MDALQGQGPERKIAGFWRRPGDLVIDLIVLGVAGMILGALLFDTFARMGVYARLIGFAIALAYFGICNSRIGGGQTLGKRWLGVRVVDAHDQLLSLPRSLLRYTVLGIPFFANGLPVDPKLAMSTPLGYLLCLVVFGGIFAIVYLYLFNRRTRQSSMISWRVRTWSVSIVRRTQRLSPSCGAGISSWWLWSIGYDMGIASGWKKHGYSFKPDERQ